MKSIIVIIFVNVIKLVLSATAKKPHIILILADDMVSSLCSKSAASFFSKLPELIIFKEYCDRFLITHLNLLTKMGSYKDVILLRKIVNQLEFWILYF